MVKLIELGLEERKDQVRRDAAWIVVVDVIPIV